MAGAEERIKAKALELGCTGVGIARAGELTGEGKRLEEWLSRGYHAGMAWMARNVERRIDPRVVLPGAKSVSALAVNYFTPARHSSAKGAGKISRYAWGDDYHRIVLDRLTRLQDWIEQEFPGERALAYVDTGPLLEKALAARAGIGWQGKHSNVITRDRGSWVFLGEVVTTLDLPPDAPAVDHCGTCTLCIEACPTGAIVEPYLVDATRCLSYLTIEHRGEIPDPPPYDGWIFGCDVCQDVCPWNTSFASPSPEPGFQPRPDNLNPPLDTWEQMSKEEFRAKFAGSPVRRAKWEGLMRNIQIVKGQQDQISDI